MERGTGCEDHGPPSVDCGRKSRNVLRGGRNGSVTVSRRPHDRFRGGPFSRVRSGGSAGRWPRRTCASARGHWGHLHVDSPGRPGRSWCRAGGGMAVRAGGRTGGTLPGGVDQHRNARSRATDDRRLRRARLRAHPRRGDAGRVPGRRRPREPTARLSPRAAQGGARVSPRHGPGVATARCRVAPGHGPWALQPAVRKSPGLPDRIRQRLLRSGLTAEQVRARLSASGYPPNLLDAYLGGASAGGAGAALPAGALELSAIQALGLPPVDQTVLAVDTGLIRMRGASTPSRVFGVDVFRRSTTQFLPLLSGPVPPDYKLGAGDQLVLILTGDVELAYTLPVTREGFILIPQVGQVFVSNLTLDQLRDMLYVRLGRGYSGVKRGPGAPTRSVITVANVRANQVYVVGEVTQPGAYQISSLGTALTALYAAGGGTERANMRGIVVQRAGKTVATLDLYDYLLRGETRNDSRLETGDGIFVPVHRTRGDLAGVGVRPAVSEVHQVHGCAAPIPAAGGFRADAALKRLSVYRLLPPAERGPGTPPRAVIDIPLASRPLGKRETGNGPPGDPLPPVRMPSLAFEDGDSVVVDAGKALAGQD